MIKNFLNLKWHQNPIIGSKVTFILLKGWISPIGGASAVEGLWSMGLLRLVFLPYLIKFILFWSNFLDTNLFDFLFLFPSFFWFPTFSDFLLFQIFDFFWFPTFVFSYFFFSYVFLISYFSWFSTFLGFLLFQISYFLWFTLFSDFLLFPIS